MAAPDPSAERVRAFRRRQREKGLRLVQFWVPDSRSPDFLVEARRQSLSIAGHPATVEDQDWVDAASVSWDDE